MRLPVLLSFIFTFHSSRAQEAVSFDKLVKETQALFRIYDSLTPFGGMYPLTGLGLTKSEIRTIREGDVLELSERKDSVESYSAIGLIQDKITDRLRKLILHPDFGKQDAGTLFSPDDLSVVKSEDNKLFNFSFDAKNGGTYRMRVSVMYYAGLQPEVIPHDDRAGGTYGIFVPDGYDAIYSLPSAEGTKYVLTASVRGCSMCFGTYVALVQFKEGSFVTDFCYSMDLRNWEEGVSYDHATKTIRVNYKTDDLSPVCSCGDEKESDETEDMEEDTAVDESKPVRKKCECRFEFDGDNFVLVKEGWEVVGE